jgi:hypothetical protein
MVEGVNECFFIVTNTPPPSGDVNGVVGNGECRLPLTNV